MKQLRAIATQKSFLLLILLIAAGYAGNYLKVSIGFSVDFLFGSIATLIVASLYGWVWGIAAAAIASLYTIFAWGHPFAFIIFTLEAAFVGWGLHRHRSNLLLLDAIYWLVLGIPLVWFLYGNVLKLDLAPTLMILVKQPVNGIFNALIANLLIAYTPLPQWSKHRRRRSSLSLEQTLLNWLVAFVLFPALVLVIWNNEDVLKHEEQLIETTLQTAATDLGAEINTWYGQGVEGLQTLANSAALLEESPASLQEKSQFTQKMLPLFGQIYILNNVGRAMASAPSASESLSLDEREMGALAQRRQLQLFEESTATNPEIFQSVPIVRGDRLLGQVLGKVDRSFIDRLLRGNNYTLNVRSTVLHNNRAIATTREQFELQQPFDRTARNGEIRTLDSGVSHWLPILTGQPSVVRWKKSVYFKQVPIGQNTPWTLAVEAPVAPYINYLQKLYIKSLAILLVLAMAAIFLANLLSRRLVQPILALARVTANLPHKLLEEQAVRWPRRSVEEINALVGNFQVMAETLKQKFQEIQQASEQVSKAKEAAETANRAKSRFIANMSHELRSPLNAILGFAQIMTRSQSLSPEQQENVSIIARSGEHLLALINNVLDLSKIEAGKTTLNLQNFDLYRLLGDIEDMFSLKAAEQELTLLFEQELDLPRYIRTDGVKLRQILINLINNALKFTTEGQVVLRVSVKGRRQKAEGRRQEMINSSLSIHFEIEDTGVGIAPQERDRLFEAFAQTEAGKQAQEGTGLGLPISRQFVRLMGGEMTVRSQVGQGTSFRFQIQVEEVDIAEFEAGTSQRRVVALEPNQPNYRILVVDDKPINRQLLVKLLSPLGFDLKEASNGREAVEMWKEWRPHLIWMDIQMPVMDGYEATRQIKTNPTGKTTQVVALTASVFEEERAVVLAAGCDDFLRKPFREDDLFDIMSDRLGVRYLYDGETAAQVQVKLEEEEAVLTHSEIAQLPPDCIAQLKQAMLTGNVDLMAVPIEEIRAQNESLAGAIERCLSSFEYEKILNLISAN